MEKEEEQKCVGLVAMNSLQPPLVQHTGQPQALTGSSPPQLLSPQEPSPQQLPSPPQEPSPQQLPSPPQEPSPQQLPSAPQELTPPQLPSAHEPSPAQLQSPQGPSPSQKLSPQQLTSLPQEFPPQEPSQPQSPSTLQQCLSSQLSSPSQPLQQCLPQKQPPQQSITVLPTVNMPLPQSAPHSSESQPSLSTSHQSQQKLPYLQERKDQTQKKSAYNQKPSGEAARKNQERQLINQQAKKLKKNLVSENQERINYLVQASQLMAVTPALPTACGLSSSQVLAAQTGGLASAVGRRCVLRISPALKRNLCKGCGTALVCGVNARVRLRARRHSHLVLTCLVCHTIKRFMNEPQYRLWCEQEEAVV